MSTPKKNTNEDVGNTGTTPETKTCFIIMPIADHPAYESGHFTRVYDHLIKPACISAGFKPVRADDSKASHMIMFDILNKIVECDMAICDLSSKNANVFYELGLRQAFNKKTILITDGIEKPPFDLAGFRYVPYSPSLRVDTVNIEIELIKEMLIDTESAPEDDVNSIVKLLKIKPAKINHVQLNENESLIFNMINKLNNKIDSIIDIDHFNSKSYNTQKVFTLGKKSLTITASGLPADNLATIYRISPTNIKDYIYSFEGEIIGELLMMNKKEIEFTHNNMTVNIPNTDDITSKIWPVKFVDG